MMSDMNYLLNLHGKYFEHFNFWACETCAEVGWSPQFKTKEEIENHINKIHINSKTKKIDIDNKIYKIVDTVKENDEEFDNFINEDINNCSEKIKFFIVSEEKLNNLDDTNFKFLIKQIESFYSENYGSLLNFNHKIDYVTDIISGKETAFILETEGKNYKIKDSANMNTVFKTEDEKPSYENLKDFCDITLACDDKQIGAHKHILRLEDCEAGDILDNSEVIVENIREVKNDIVDMNEEFIKIEFKSIPEDRDKIESEIENDNNVLLCSEPQFNDEDYDYIDKTDNLCDVALACDDKQLKIHKTIPNFCCTEEKQTNDFIFGDKNISIEQNHLQLQLTENSIKISNNYDIEQSNNLRNDDENGTYQFYKNFFTKILQNNDHISKYEYLTKDLSVEDLIVHKDSDEIEINLITEANSENNDNIKHEIDKNTLNAIEFDDSLIINSQECYKEYIKKEAHEAHSLSIYEEKKKQVNIKQSHSMPSIRNTCIQCVNQIEHETYLIMHSKIGHKKFYKCICCEYEAFQEYKINLHVKTQGGHICNCELCAFVSMTKSYLTKHIKIAHKDLLIFNEISKKTKKLQKIMKDWKKRKK